MTEKDLIIYLYEGLIGVNQCYYLNILQKDGYNVDYYAKRRVDDLTYCIRIDSLLRDGQEEQAKEIFDEAADKYEEYKEMEFLEMLEYEKIIPWED